MKTTAKQSGSVSIDPKKMDIRDLQEGACMLYSAMTLLRQSFGIVSMVNELLDKPFTQDELKSFGKSFDIVHSSLGSCYKGLSDYVRSKQGNAN